MTLRPDWISETLRRDGLRIASTMECNWIVLSNDPAKPPITACPCCAKPFAKAEFARNVADALRPLADG